MEDAEARLERLERQVEELLPTWSIASVVEAMQAMRGIGLIVTVTVTAEVGDFSRLANPSQLMAYLGLVRSEHSSGTSNPPRRHHQGRQHPGPPGAHRGRLDLSHAGEGQPQAARPDRTPAPGDPRHRLASATAPVPPLPPSGGCRQAQGGGNYRIARERGCASRPAKHRRGRRWARPISTDNRQSRRLWP